MKEPDFDASSLETPDVEPADVTAEPDDPAPADPTADTPEQGFTLEVAEEEFYVRRGTMRRRPKYGVFGTLGGLVGLIAGLVLAQVGTIPGNENYTRTDLSIVLVGLGVPLGILLAMILALMLDRRRK